MEKETYRRSSGKEATQKKGKFPKVIGITLLHLDTILLARSILLSKF